MSTTEELLKLSIVYRRLIDDLEAICGSPFTPTQKHRMMEVVNSAMGDALNVYVARCSRCDASIDLVCEECEVVSDKHGSVGRK